MRVRIRYTEAMKKGRAKNRSEHDSELGAALVEYALPIALIALIAATAIPRVSQSALKGFCRTIAGMDRNSAPYFVAAANGQPARCLRSAGLNSQIYF